MSFTIAVYDVNIYILNTPFHCRSICNVQRTDQLRSSLLIVVCLELEDYNDSVECKLYWFCILIITEEIHKNHVKLEMF